MHPPQRGGCYWTNRSEPCGKGVITKDRGREGAPWVRPTPLWKEVGRPDRNLKDPVRPLGYVVGISPGHGPYTSDMKGQTRPPPTLPRSLSGDVVSYLRK